MAKLNVPNSHHLQHLQTILASHPKARFDAHPPANLYTDWSHQYASKPAAALFPATTDQVCQILSYAHTHRLAVVPQGGLTGLVGASVPTHPSQFILSLSAMNAILAVNETEGWASVEAGVVLESLDQAVKRHGLMVPIDLGSKGSCQVGGLIACNAGGSRFRRYGGLHANCAGLEVVLPSGHVLNLRNTLRKRNTGFDLKHLFIGSEGLIGVITKAELFCPKRPSATALAVLQVAGGFDKIVAIFSHAESSLGPSMAAFEFWDGECERMVKNTLHKSLHDSPFSVMIELHGQDQCHLDDALQSLLEDCFADQLIEDALVASDHSQQAQMWAVREGISEACARTGHVCKYDIALSLDHLYQVVEAVRARFGQCIRTAVGFGHVGDGNLHLNIILSSKSDELKAELDDFVYQFVHSKNGSISAEHGIGQLKLKPFNELTDKTVLETGKAIKQLFDPHGIMNPGKVYE